MSYEIQFAPNGFPSSQRVHSDLRLSQYVKDQSPSLSAAAAALLELFFILFYFF